MALGDIGKLDLLRENLGEATRSLDKFEGHGQRCTGKNMREWRWESFGQRMSLSSLNFGTMLDGLRLRVSGFVV